MKLLALETSTEMGSCALWLDGRVLVRYCPSGRPHSETLLPLVRELLQEAGAVLPDLDAIAFGSGPGAFTGLRVACGAAQGLAVGAGVPLVAVGSLDALAWRAGGDAVLALVDARMEEVYWGAFRRIGGDVELVDALGVASPDVLDLPEGFWQAAGNALIAYPGLAGRASAAGYALDANLFPDAEAVAALAVQRFPRQGGIDPAEAAPRYVRNKVARTVAERLAAGGRA